MTKTPNGVGFFSRRNATFSCIVVYCAQVLANIDNIVRLKLNIFSKNDGELH